MNLSESDLAFQVEVRNFIDQAWPREVRIERGSASDYSEERPPEVQRWFDALSAKGWSVPNWPVEKGGTGWSPTQKFIWDRETAKAGCPVMSAFGARMLAPVLYTWGTEEQQARFLPPIREAKVQWCQGYSEPGAGSDLAALKTRAVRDGDHYIVNGEKTWTSGAHRADWMFCLVRTRTDVAKRQQGISFLLIDMKTPGIEVHPILILGEQHTVNSVTLTDVRVPTENLVGEENKGWTYAKGLLTHERTGIAGVARSQIQLQKLKDIAAETAVDGGQLMDDDGFRRKIQEVEVELMALEMTELRTLATVEEGGAPGPESSILKLKGTFISQRIAELQMEAFGYYSIPYPNQVLIDNEGPVGPEYAIPAIKGMLFGRASTIFGGSTEIQKNIVAKAVLGL